MDDPMVHSLRSTKQTPDQARMEINAWIRFNMKIAFEHKAKGDMKNARFYFYTAMHTLHDSTSKFTNDKEGNPAVMDGSLVPVHVKQANSTWRDRISDDMEFMFENEYFPAGDLLRMYGIDTESGPIDRPNQLPRPVLKR